MILCLSCVVVFCTVYVGITSNATDFAGTLNAQNPYETIDSTKTHGTIYKGNAPTTENPIPTEGETSITEPGSLVWKIGDMAPNESRTLTYYVKLKDNVALAIKKSKIRRMYTQRHIREYMRCNIYTEDFLHHVEKSNGKYRKEYGWIIYHQLST